MKRSPAPADRSKKIDLWYGIVIVLYLFEAVLVWCWYCSFSYSMAPEELLYLDSFYLCYPPKGSEAVVLGGSLLAVAFLLIAHYFFVRHARGAVRAVLVFLCVAFFFLPLELALRNFSARHPFKYRPHPVLLWQYTPFYRGDNHRINSMGMRYPEFPVKKEPGEIRFLLAGDSNAYGFGVEETQRFGNVLEEKLRKAHPRVTIRVIDAAVEGYTSFQVMHLTKSRLLRYSPDFLVISVINDTGGDFSAEKDKAAPPSLAALFDVLYRSELFLLVKKTAYTARVKGMRDAVANSTKRFQYKMRVSLEDVRDFQTQAVDAVKATGGKGIIVSMPRCPEKASDNEAKHAKVMEQVCADTGSLFVDLWGRWKARGDFSGLFMEDLVHLNIDGHRRAGDDIYEAVTSSGLVKAR